MGQLHKSQLGAAASATVVGIVMLVIGGLIGFGITKAADKNDNGSSTNSSSMVMSSDKANKLQTDLVTLGIDHMTLTDQAVDAALDGSPSANAFGTALNNNGKAIGAAVGSVYGTDAQQTVDKVWQLHLDDFVKFATAAKSGDQAGKTAALTDINTNYTKPLAQYLAKANPNLPEATLESGLNQHIQMTAQMIEYHVQGNYSAEANELNMANSHIAGLFSTLANAIVKQYPNKF